VRPRPARRARAAAACAQRRVCAQIGKAFRNEGVDATHNPEFTSVEAYQARPRLSKRKDSRRPAPTRRAHDAPRLRARVAPRPPPHPRGGPRRAC
jgi:hypothetical protein